ncbi:hypothetical protein [Prosthecobacter sp.]|uniref:hypothetical protein n=1 Tax=Prosthecobacter sp. TaxID=1965333 RepID=UPI002ABCC815|nr:hypothetical protein [Prosthecobacter sp.]MDZ4401297.1 hypothetical protein [Prosthecobacter sp.]
MNSVSPILWYRRKLLLAGLAACGCHVSAKAEDAPHVRILFLGNSYTAHNGLPAIVGELLLSSKVLAPHIGSYLQGGFKLEQHATDSKALALLKQGADDGKPWDVVVVQEQSVLSSLAAVNGEAQQYMNGGLSKLVALAREVNPRMLIVDFQVWARHERLWKKKAADALSTGTNADDAHARIRRANVNAVQVALAKNPGANLVVSPVGDFWRLVQDVYPAMSLYEEDGTHPDMMGSMLTGLIIAGTIGGREVIEKSAWIGECPFAQVERLKKVLLDHPEVFKSAGK